MATTVYTYNDKVLKNVATDKWLKKKEAPAGFVMNASNATYTMYNNTCYISWQSPSYPNVYNGDGKQYILVNNNATAPSNDISLNYASTNDTTGYSGPSAINGSAMNVLGSSTGTLANNPAVGYNFGLYLTWILAENWTLEQVQAYMANITITILDP